MKLALAQLNYHIGNFEKNLEKIIAAILQAEKQGAELVVFGELAVCGYPPRDFLDFDDFINKSMEAVKRLKDYSHTTGILIGLPIKNPKVEGKDLFNAAAFLYQGEIQQFFRKTLLPTYDVFDEYRYFEPNDTFELLHFKGKKIAVTICEDIWNIGNENPLYPICPMDILIKDKPDFAVNLSASPFTYKHADERHQIVQENVNRYQIPMVYVNHVGAQTELIFDGGSMVYGKNGKLLAELNYFEEEIKTVDLVEDEELMATQPNKDDKIKRIHDALVLGIKDYFGKLGFNKAILGMSGGIDSAVTLALACEALGSENVMAVMMPSQFSSNHSVDDSVAMIEKLGCKSELITIEKAFNAFADTLSPQFKDLPFNVTEENIQARCRAVILMAMSNKFGYILLNTSNKSEAAVGYGTLYGDMCGGISVIGDVYKTEVYELARYINTKEEIIPINIIDKAPSAELRPNQKDSDSLPDYAILDRILFEYIEKCQGPNEIKALGFDTDLVDRVLRMVNMNEWKRYQTPPMLRVSPKAFGMGRRMPIVGKYLS